MVTRLAGWAAPWLLALPTLAALAVLAAMA